MQSGKQADDLVGPTPELVLRPTTTLPYIFGAFWLVIAVVSVVVYVTQPRNGPDLVLFSMVILPLGIAVVSIVPRFAGLPRLRLKGNRLRLERYFGRTTEIDLSNLGNAFVFPVRYGICIGFPDAKEEQALRRFGNADLIDQFSAKHVLRVTAMVGFSVRKAQNLAYAINVHRLPIGGENMLQDEVLQLNRTAVSRRHQVWALCFGLIAGAYILAALTQGKLPW